MSPSTVLDLIHDTFGEPLRPDLINAVPKMNHTEFVKLFEAAVLWEASFELPYKPIMNLRPYIPYLNSFVHYEWMGDEAPFWTADKIKHHLLFSHSLAIGSPIVNLASNLASNRGNVKRLLKNHLVTLLQLAPLIDAGIVTYVPLPDGSRHVDWLSSSDTFRYQLLKYMGGIESKRSAAFMTSLAPLLDMSDFPYFTVSPVEDPRLPKGVTAKQAAVIWEAYNVIGEAMGLVVATNAAVDLYMGYRHQELVLHWLLTAGQVENVDQHALEFMILNDLIRLKLPALQNLNTKDLVAIRLHEETFEAWRSSLARALTQLHSMNREDLSNEQQRSFVALQLEESARELRAKIRKKQLASLTRNALSDFSLGAVAVVGASAIGGALGAATAASLGGLALKDVVKLIVDRRPNRSDNAQLSHYAVFR